MPKTAVTRVTHSRHLIEIGGRTFLTDHVVQHRPGYYQGEPTAVGIPELPPLDGVLISHQHCDLEALAAYRDKSMPLVVAETVVDAARLPELPVPHHYAFTKGFPGDRLITRGDKDPLRFQAASRDLTPETSVRIVEPGIRVEL